MLASAGEIQMSDGPESPHDSPSGVAIGVVVRLLTIILGIMSALAMARDGLGIRLNALVDNIINVYSGGLEYVALLVLGPAITALLAEIHAWFALDLELHTHWKHSVVLLWLFFSSYARTLAKDYPNPVLVWVAAGLSALGGGVAGGLVPLTHAGALFGPMGFYLFFLAATMLPAPNAFRLRAILIALGLATLFGGVALGHNAVKDPSRALFALTLLIAFMGLVLLFVMGLRFRERERGTFLNSWLNYGYGAAGLNILAVLGGAAFIVWLGHALA